MTDFFDIIMAYSSSLIVMSVFLMLIIIMNVIFRHAKTSSDSAEINRKILLYLIAILGIMIFIIALPIDRQLKGQILSFLGILISAAIALSSTTILGNLIAGIMNNSMNRFRNGDLIKIGDIQGRVTKKSVFHIEIQLEDSNFLTIPNLYIATNPVKLIRKSDTVISAGVSLGYDVPRLEIEKSLIEAANRTGLKDPFVYISQLLDHAVSYRVHGFLNETDKYFSSISRLKGNIIDALHEKNIEIVSPEFKNQRRVDDKVFISKNTAVEDTAKAGVSPEEMVFDKAIKSEKIEKKKDSIEDMEKKKEQLRQQLKGLGGEQAKQIKEEILMLTKAQEDIRKRIDSQKKILDEE